MRVMRRRLLLIVLGLAAAACTTGKPGSAPAAVAAPPGVAVSRAAERPMTIFSRPVATSGAALAAFRKSCPALKRREDISGLTVAGDWDAACADPEADPAIFFERHFDPVAIDAGKGFATGYFEPEIAGSRVRTAGYQTPFYRPPLDLVEADLGAFAPDLKGRKLRGRVEGQAMVPYFDRARIAAGALAGRNLELAFAADPFEAFFLEIQGSGRLRLPDGSVMRIGYAGQNGHPYVAIGKVLLERGDLPRGGVSMQAILGWLRANPAKAPALLAANPSQVFFREITGATDSDGPIGALGVAVTAGVSVAADPAFVPLGAPVFVETELPGGKPLAALMVAQDSGGAIKGANRVDLFRGAGALAQAEAGGLQAAARVMILLPRGAVSRLMMAPQAAARAPAPAEPR